ncbi:MAG: hypothetical protein RIS44_942 [Pseudomonadota bacterium]|jgi:hypothetical protein
MAKDANSLALAARARRSYVEGLLNAVPSVVQAVEQAARHQLTQVAERGLVMRRRDLVDDLQKAAPFWLSGMVTTLQEALSTGSVPMSRFGDLSGPDGRANKMSLVDNDTIEGEILSSRLALAMMDRASWEFTDLRSRISALEGRDEFESNDILRPHVLARIATNAWRLAGLSHDGWQLLQIPLHDELSHFAEEAYHETNRWLIAQHVLPEIDLRPFIRRSRASSATTPAGSPSYASTSAMGATDRVGGYDDTRPATQTGPLVRGADHAQAVLSRLNKMVSRHLPEFADTAHAHPTSAGLTAAIAVAQQGVVQRMQPAPGSDVVAATQAEATSAPMMLEELAQRKQALKQAAASPVERATIEIVALLFQSILMEERIPATVRVWFARLQMPVLRVAVSEPDFFAATEHPARRLIDRMGACVMGFDNHSSPLGETFEKEIKRVVQVVEAYPDTGRRVFQTVLNEFEKFLENYFSKDNETTRKGVSLAQQVEQRETLAIQYTIELRKMLSDVPVQEGVRDFLFQVWADVLAMTAVKSGKFGDEIKEMKGAATDLIWSASAKVTRDERADVIRRLPPLLKLLRDGMQNAGVPVTKQDEHIQTLNDSLAAAFTAKTASIPHARLEELKARLETLEELLPEADDMEIDSNMVMDLSGHESAELEVVASGGSAPTPAMLAWTKDLQVGGWYKLDYRDRNEAVQLAWQGMRKQLHLFVSPQGRGILFQQHRLAAFLQSGLLVPAQDESLTTRATRNAMAKLDADPSRLLG